MLDMASYVICERSEPGMFVDVGVCWETDRHLERLQWLFWMEGLRRQHLRRHSRGGSGIRR
jgi:hypothetical protein